MYSFRKTFPLRFSIFLNVIFSKEIHFLNQILLYNHFQFSLNYDNSISRHTEYKSKKKKSILKIKEIRDLMHTMEKD